MFGKLYLIATPIGNLRLVADDEISSFSNKDNTIQADVNMPNVMDENTEYLLVFTIPSTPPARTTPSTGCPCRPSGCWAQTAIAGNWCTSAIRTSKCAWAHSKIKSVCHGLRAATNAFFMKGDVR